MYKIKTFTRFLCIVIFSIWQTSFAADSPYTPETIQPSGAYTYDGATISFRWKAVQGATEYDYIAYDLVDGTWGGQWNLLLSNDEFYCQASSGECWKTHGFSGDITRGIWKIRARVNGIWRGWSAYSNFTLAQVQPPEVISPKGASQSTSNAVTFRWRAVPDATAYDYIAYNLVDGTWDGQWNLLFPPSDKFYCKTSTEECWKTHGISDDINQGIWKIRALVNNNWSEWSEYTNFTLSDQTSVTSYPSYFPPATNYTSQWQPANPQNFDGNTSVPAFLSNLIDPDTSLPVWRLGGNKAEMTTAALHPDGNNADMAVENSQHYYSRVSPTNNDESYILSAGAKGYAALWKLSSKQLVAWLPLRLPQSEYQQGQLLWDKNRNNVFWYTAGHTLYRATINFDTYVVGTEAWDSFPEYDYIAIGPGEGDFSDDGTKLVIAGKVKNSGENKLFTIIPYIVDTKQRVASKTISQMDWVGVDPTGQYLVYGQEKSANAPNGVHYVAPFDLTSSSRVLYNHVKHSDFVVDKKGESWIVYGNSQGLFATKLSSPLLKRFWPTEVDAGDPANLVKGELLYGSFDNSTRKTMSGHVSRVSGLPGVVLVSRDLDGGLYFLNIDDPEKTFYAGNSRHGKPYPGALSNPVTDDERVLMDRYGNLQGGFPAFYQREPRGSASPSGKYIFFTSDYFVHTGQYYSPRTGASSEGPRTAYLNMIELEP